MNNLPHPGRACLSGVLPRDPRKAMQEEVALRPSWSRGLRQADGPSGMAGPSKHGGRAAYLA